MRMNQSEKIANAADVINTASVGDLIQIFSKYGEERYAREIARGISLVRKQGRIETTQQLAKIVAKAKSLGYPYKTKPKINPATQTFQALRIYVNDELKELANGLNAAEGILKPDSILAVIVFHSLEDRIVKNFIRYCCSADKIGSGEDFEGPSGKTLPTFRFLDKRQITPTNEEIERNPRARSARLRVAARTHNKPLTPLMDLNTLTILPHFTRDFLN